MRQILSNLKTGAVDLVEVPTPYPDVGDVLIRTVRSLVSLGTEKMLVQFGRASLFQKARSQPEKVKQVLAKVRADGLLPTLETVFRRLDEPLPLGYCNVGEVIGLGANVRGFAVGDRVISNGPHAEFVAVPQNLVAAIPPGVSDDEAAFTVLGAIALQGIRLARPELGETFVVIGLGLVGQLTAQLLSAAGCRVVAYDFDTTKVALAQRHGAVARAITPDFDQVRDVLTLTGGLGADGVMITASASSHEIISASARMCRKRGRIILIGVVGLNLNRADFYEKEITFQVSCSYGPGRYEDAYERQGLDYPPAFIRWTENRNFQAVLSALATRRLQVGELITRRTPLAEYRTVYDHLDGGDLASILVYPVDAAPQRSIATGPAQASRPASHGALAVIGAGNFTKMTALPALRAARARVKTIVSANGVSGTALARKYGVEVSATDYTAVLADPEISGVVITTRHDIHASQVQAAVAAGKHVLVEKPVALTAAELAAVDAAQRGARATVTVGYNRRFAPAAQQMQRLLRESRGPYSVVITVNAGEIPANHWLADPAVGGGRLVGEACHFVDLAIFLTGALVARVAATSPGDPRNAATLVLTHTDGSVSTVHYLTNGNRAVAKERIEAHVGGRSLLLDNFRVLTGYGFKSFRKLKTRQDKGHTAEFAEFARRVATGGEPLIPWREVHNGMEATLAVATAIDEGRTIVLPSASL